MFRKVVESSSLREVADQAKCMLEEKYGVLSKDQYALKIFTEVRKITAGCDPAVFMAILKGEIAQDDGESVVTALCQSSEIDQKVVVILPFEENEEGEQGVVSLYTEDVKFEKEMTLSSFLDSYNLVLDLVPEVGVPTMIYVP